MTESAKIAFAGFELEAELLAQLDELAKRNERNRSAQLRFLVRQAVVRARLTEQAQDNAK